MLLRPRRTGDTLSRRLYQLGLVVVLWTIESYAIESSVAHAHLGSVTDVVVETSPEGYHATLTIEAADASEQLGLASDVSGEALALRVRAIERWISEGMHFSRGTTICENRISGFRQGAHRGREVLFLDLDATCRTEGEGRFRDDTVFDDDPQHETYVRDLEGDTIAVLRRGRREANLDGDADVWAFFRLGVEHFATGLDHVLFLLGLIFAVLIRRTGEGLRKLFLAVASIATAFTVGHSLTLASAALSFPTPPTSLTEVTIALSVGVVAVDNLIRKKAGRTSLWHAAIYAFSFGLMHGFGFSTLLLERSMEGAARLWALVLFNIGIEVAQLGMILVVVLLVSRLSLGRRMVLNRIASTVMLVAASIWVVQRAFV